MIRYDWGPATAEVDMGYAYFFGAFDTKGTELAYVAGLVCVRGVGVIPSTCPRVGRRSAPTSPLGRSPPTTRRRRPGFTGNRPATSRATSRPSDLAMLHSVTDVAGLNLSSRWAWHYR